MIKYKYVLTANGRDMYFKNGKMVSKTEIPAEILPRLESGVELQMGSPVENEELTVDQEQVDEAQSEQNELPKGCLFCGEEATRQRYVNQQIVVLCDKDYETHTTGELAEQIRKIAKDN